MIFVLLRNRQVAVVHDTVASSRSGVRTVPSYKLARGYP